MNITGKRLRELRELKGMSQEDVAKCIGVGRTTYLKYESGENRPVRKLNELTTLFNVTTDYLLGNDTGPRPTVNVSGNATINGAAINSGSVTVTTGAPPAPDRECLDILENFFGHSPEAMELIKHIKVTNGKLDIPKDKAEFLRYVKDNMIAAFNQALKEGHPERIEVPLPQQG